MSGQSLSYVFSYLRQHSCAGLSSGFFVVWLIGFLLIYESASSATEIASKSNLEAIESVLTGQSTVANAAWWGFDAVDSTDSIQSAINSGATTVIIPFTGNDWIVRPIVLASNQEIFLEPGVVIAAKVGSFGDPLDALILGREVQNVKITGYGAVARMRKADYLASDYAPSEWRHALAFYGSSDIHVTGLTLQSSGGDGIYIGPTGDARRVPCKNIRIVDCTCDDNLRQGISVVSAENVQIVNCTLRNTRGRAPQAGIDIEPSNWRDLAVNIEIRNCYAVDNSGSGFFVNLSRMTRNSEPASIRIVDSVVRNSHQPGLRAVLTAGGNARGAVEFINCTCEDVAYAGVAVIWNAQAAIKLGFTDCKWRNVARRSNEAPIFLDIQNGTVSGRGGGITFNNCYIYDEKVRAPVKFVTRDWARATAAVSGKIHLINSRIDNLVGFGTENLPELTIIHRRSQE